MILDDLYRLYGLKLDSKDVTPRGWSREKVSWELCIDADGRLVSVLPRTTDDKRQFVWMDVPEHGARTSGVKPFFLCDNASYFLGLDERAGVKKHESSRALHHRYLDSLNDPAARAVLAFFEDGNVIDLSAYAKDDALLNGLMVFRFLPDATLVHEREAIKTLWNEVCVDEVDEGSVIQCGVTGVPDKAARLFPLLRGIRGAQSSGASLVSFNKESFCSYGKSSKDQAASASMGLSAAYGAGAALRYLADRENGHCVSIGDTQILFWTDRETQVELDELSLFLNPDGFEEKAGEDEALLQELHARLSSIRAGLPSPGIHVDTRCFILGLSPNAARLSIRFYEEGTLGKLEEHFASYLQDTEMVSCKDGASSLKPRSIGAYVRQTAVLGKPENVPSTLVASTMHAMICGKPFPMPLYLQLLERTKVDKGYSGSGTKTYDAMRLRVPMLKACLLRFARQRKDVELERSLTVALNEENTNAGYLLGRLFAVLEKAQRDALGKNINATIRDRYIGSASTTPARVFPQLLRLAQYHISKSEYGGVSDRLIERIASTMDGSEAAFPSTLSYDDQGQFFIGYYQQKASFFVKKDDDNNKED